MSVMARSPASAQGSGTLALPVEAALAPVRETLLRGALSDAAAARARGDRAAAMRREQAAEDAAALLGRARAEGRSIARSAAAARARGARRQARGIVLAAQRRLYEELRSRAVQAALGLHDDPGYPALIERWRRAALASLGEGALVQDVPEGGVRAGHGGRSLDLSLTALAEDAFERLGPEAGSLWAP